MEGIESEPIPIASTTKAVSDIISNHGSEPEPHIDEVEDYLKERAKSGYPHALFQLGHFYFEQERYNQAKVIFERIQERDYQAKYLLAVMHYDGIGIDENHKLGIKYMEEIANTKNNGKSNLIASARYNLGRAYLQGFGVKQSSDEAERLWILAAQGDEDGSIRAQTALGLFYSQEESLDLQKAFYWHKIATANGSLESQGALGAMYWKGQGTKQNVEAALNCFKQASERGNVYAQGCLVAHYYTRKLYKRAVELAKMITTNEDAMMIARATDCLPNYIVKGMAMSCFYYARCLQNGLGTNKDDAEAKKYYSKACSFDLDIVAALQQDMTFGFI